MKQVFIGIDQSLSKTGVVLFEIRDSQLITSTVIASKPRDDHMQIKRMIEIKEKLKSLIKEHEVVQGVMEGFGFGAKGNAVFDLGGLGYIVRELFVEENIPLLVIAPTTLKKYVTGKGNTKKDLMIAKVYQRWNHLFEDDNVADAYGLVRLAADLYYVKCTGDEDYLKKNDLTKELLENHYYQILETK